MKSLAKFLSLLASITGILHSQSIIYTEDFSGSDYSLLHGTSTETTLSTWSTYSTGSTNELLVLSGKGIASGAYNTMGLFAVQTSGVTTLSLSADFLVDRPVNGINFGLGFLNSATSLLYSPGAFGLQLGYNGSNYTWALVGDGQTANNSGGILASYNPTATNSLRFDYTLATGKADAYFNGGLLASGVDLFNASGTDFNPTSAPYAGFASNGTYNPNSIDNLIVTLSIPETSPNLIIQLASLLVLGCCLARGQRQKEAHYLFTQSKSSRKIH